MTAFVWATEKILPAFVPDKHSTPRPVEGAIYQCLLAGGKITEEEPFEFVSVPLAEVRGFCSLPDSSVQAWEARSRGVCFRQYVVELSE